MTSTTNLQATSHSGQQTATQPVAPPRTPSQTIGPFSHEAWRWAVDATAPSAASAVSGSRTIRLHGVIHDGAGQPVNDAVIEAWLPQAASGETALPMPGFRRVPSDDAGSFAFSVPAPDASSAGQPLMYITVFARGLVRHQFSAVFLEDDAALADSAILAQVPQARRGTLLARREADGAYRWDIHLQGAAETVFLDFS